jgi:adenylate cyclase
MLKLKPRSITIALLLFFVLVFAIQHAVYLLSLSSDAQTARIASSALTNQLPILPWLDRIDYDLHTRAQKTLKPNPMVGVVEINERSLRELGQFPFPRRTYREFLRRMAEAGAKVVAFDITFPERENNQTTEELRRAAGELALSEGEGSKAAALLHARATQLDGDKAFADGLRGTKVPVVLGYAFDTQGNTQNISENSRRLLQRYDIFRRQLQDDSFLASMSDYAPVLPHDGLIESLSQGSSLGFFTADADTDSVIRRAVAVMGYDKMALPSLAVQAVSSYLGVTPALNGSSGLVLEDKEENGKLHVPLSPSGSSLLRYYGKGHTFEFVEFSDVVNGKANLKLLKDKIIFVGATAVGLRDLRASPFDQDYPGVEVHATFASNMLNSEFMLMDGRFFLAGYAFLLLIILGSSYFVFRLQPLWGFALTLGSLVAFQLAAQDICFDNGVVVPTLLPSFAAIAMLFAGVFYRYFSEAKEKKETRAAFSRYVSSDVVGEILKDPSKLRLGGQKKELTVMFCDLVGFTKLSENMDAEQLTLLLNEYFTRMTRIILRNHGTLDKYMGDAIMCFWGAPIDLPGHADYACLTAIEMMKELDAINADWKAKYGLTIGCRIGVNTGEMAVGNMGSEQIFSYTVMGDNVNLGSRLEGVNNVYGTWVIVSESTKKAAGSAFRYRNLDRVAVKGKAEAVEIHELVGIGAGPAPEWLITFERGLDAYRSGRWEEAEAAFGTVISLKQGDAPSEVFLERIREFRMNAPADWNGVWKLTSK